MNGAQNTAEITICVDCCFLLANGDVPDERPNLADEIAAIWGDSEITLGRFHQDHDHDDNDLAIELCEEPFFSWQPCGACGSTLGGDREYATAWWEEER